MRAGAIILGVLVYLAVLFVSVDANAQAYECDDAYGDCGTPEQSGGGGGGCGCGGVCVGDDCSSILVNNTDLGSTYQYADDYDDDGIEDPYDNCAFARNQDQADSDGDGVGDSCDMCIAVSDADQLDLDGDGIGDACDPDMDGDGIENGADNCAERPNPEMEMVQPDADGDGEGDACDSDDDGDGIADLEDNCPLISNPDQGPITGSGCYSDADGDGVPDHRDNCAQIANPELADLDLDGLGDECDTDMDGDGVTNAVDNCPMVGNEEQVDADRDGLGDGCDSAYCYVVFGDTESCLDPEGSFAAYTPSLFARTGDEVRLRLFANRENAALRYSWTIVEAPNGSGATIGAPYGAARLSTPYEYHYMQSHTPTLVPDLPGTYRVRVEVTQVWEDAVSGEAEVVREAFGLIEVEGPAQPIGCSAVPGSPAVGSVAFLLLVALGAVRRFRRR